MEIDISGTGIQVNTEQELRKRAIRQHEKLISGNLDLTGWAILPMEFDQNILNDIKATAKVLRNKCSLLVVIGIGGSYLGARAVIEALNDSKECYPEIVFAGYNMSGANLNKVIKQMRHESVCLCVISKSGTTIEPLLAFSILKEKLFEKYGENEGKKRIYVITDKEKGILCEEATKNEYKSFVVPNDIGGRYSVLSPVGLLPIAAAGHDIDKLLKGAADIGKSNGWEQALLEYAICRVALQKQGKVVEVFEYFETNLNYFGEWLKQLFCESEGKDGKGVFTTCLCFSGDLHSVGQFLQQGTPIFYETLIRIRKAEHDFIIPESAGKPFAGKTLEAINDCAEEGVVIAHKKEGIPITTIEIPVLDEYNLGQLIYFFEMSCAISAGIIGVNPFDQPGVEAYKREMRNLVEKL